MKPYSLIILSVLWLLFAVIHLFFNKSLLYWYYSWLDIMMHLIGGILFVTTFFKLKSIVWFKDIFNKLSLHPMFILLVVAILWEISQFFSGKPLKDNYIEDTALDILIGLIGGLVAFGWFSSRKIDK